MVGSRGKLENVNPHIYEKKDERLITTLEEDENEVDLFDEREVFDLIRNINDPEHPLTLEELKVVEESNVNVDNKASSISIQYTPTIPHCSMATLIGLSITVQLLRTLPPRFKIKVSITPGTHSNEHDVNKQLSDKERVAAALENSHLLEVVNQCLKTKMMIQ